MASPVSHPVPDGVTVGQRPNDTSDDGLDIVRAQTYRDGTTGFAWYPTGTVVKTPNGGTFDLLGLTERVAALEARPQGSDYDDAPLVGRVDAVESTVSDVPRLESYVDSIIGTAGELTLLVREHTRVPWTAGNAHRLVTEVWAGIEYDWTCIGARRDIAPSESAPGEWRLDHRDGEVYYVPHIIPHILPGQRVQIKDGPLLQYIGGALEPNALPAADDVLWRAV